MTDVSVEHTQASAEEHPSHEKQYWIIFAVLAVVTALEVAWSYMGLSGVALWLPLVLMMILKFVIVAGIFMHLYFDLAIMNGRIYMYMFTFGLLIAVAVFIGILHSERYLI